MIAKLGSDFLNYSHRLFQRVQLLGIQLQTHTRRFKSVGYLSGVRDGKYRGYKVLQ